MTRQRRVALGVAALIGLPLLFVVGRIGYAMVRTPIQIKAVPFDSTRWKAKTLDDDVMWPTRLRMIDDLVKRRILVGASRARVEELLGPPNPPEYFKGWDMVYQLGPAREFIRIDSEWLLLRLGQAGTVTDVRIEED